MAGIVYRSDQALVTFASEAGDGGPAERSRGTVISLRTWLTTAAVPGDRSITVNSNASSTPITGYANGDIIQIGAGKQEETEIRRIVLVDGTTFYLDTPLGFAHAASYVGSMTSSGTTTTTVDTAATYQTDLIKVGDIVFNDNRDLFATVTVIGSETALTFTPAISGHTNADVYQIAPLSGQVYKLAANPTFMDPEPIKAQTSVSTSSTTVTTGSGFTAASIAIGDIICFPSIGAQTPITGITDTAASHTAVSGLASAGDVFEIYDATSASFEDGMHITYTPGIYETVETPDPQPTLEPRYFLGESSKRNWSMLYAGQQQFEGSIGSFTLLDGTPIRFPFGNVVTEPNSKDAYGTPVTVSGAHNKGDIYVAVNSVTGVAVGDRIVFEYTASPVSTTKMECRQIIAIDTTLKVLTLNYPLSYAHASGATIDDLDGSSAATYFTHTIHEATSLDSLTWNVHMRSSDESATKDLDRRYVGGKVGNANLAAEESGMLTMSWDGVQFMDMVHNQQLHTGVSDTVSIARYNPFQTITDGEAGRPTNSGGAIAHTYPTDKPYYFSEGSLTVFGVEFAKVRSFNLQVSNNEEPRYYINRQHGVHRGPSEIREGRREYSMSANIALPDAITDTATTKSLFKELILEGDYATDPAASTSRTGFAITMTFVRDTNDKITITIPDDGTAAQGINKQGAFIRSAPHNLSLIHI